jgi:hypothetical protein
MIGPRPDPRPKLQDVLLEKDMYAVTNHLKEETMSGVDEILDKYH